MPNQMPANNRKESPVQPNITAELIYPLDAFTDEQLARVAREVAAGADPTSFDPWYMDSQVSHVAANDVVYRCGRPAAPLGIVA